MSLPKPPSICPRPKSSPLTWTTAIAPHCAPSVRPPSALQSTQSPTNLSRLYHFSSPNLPVSGFSLHWELLTTQPPRSPLFTVLSGLDAIFHTCQVFPRQDIYTHSPWNADAFVVFKVCSNIISQQVLPGPSLSK